MEERITRGKVIRLKCLDCCCGSAHEVKLCPAENCPLHPFRFGSDPYRTKRKLSPEQRDALKSRLTHNTPIKSGKKLKTILLRVLLPQQSNNTKTQ